MDLSLSERCEHSTDIRLIRACSALLLIVPELPSQLLYHDLDESRCDEKMEGCLRMSVKSGVGHFGDCALCLVLIQETI